jgi:ribosomal-protein-alanine N-acetyltransferase
MSGLEIRPAGPADLEAIAAIQAAALPGSRWRPADYLRYICSVAVFEGVVRGFLAVRDIAGEREILNLAVEPAYRRRGIAAALLRGELRRCSGTCFLEVRESNQAARALYRNLGFQEIATRSGYYENPPEGAIVMRFFSC